MRFTDNAELTAANMATTDILAGTDVSASTDKKFTLSGLADWFLNRFTGLSLAGKNQSVKAALDELNSTLKHTTVEGTSNASGNIEANIPSTSTFVTMTAPGSTYLIIPFKAGTKWYGKVVTRVGTALNVAVNVTATIEIDYV